VALRDSLTLRPSWRKVGRSSLARLGPLSILYVVGLFWLGGAGGGKDSLWEALPLGFLGIYLMADLVYRMSLVIHVDSTSLEIRSILRRPRVVARSEVRGVALRRVSRYLSSWSVAIIVGRNDRSFATLSEIEWDETNVNRLRGAIGSLDRTYREVSYVDYRNQFPGATHDNFGWAMAFAVIVLVFVGVYFQTR
jgi:hypothetical protein